MCKTKRIVLVIVPCLVVASIIAYYVINQTFVSQTQHIEKIEGFVQYGTYNNTRIAFYYYDIYPKEPLTSVHLRIYGNGELIEEYTETSFQYLQLHRLPQKYEYLTIDLIYGDVILWSETVKVEWRETPLGI